MQIHPTNPHLSRLRRLAAIRSLVVALAMVGVGGFLGWILLDTPIVLSLMPAGRGSPGATAAGITAWVLAIAVPASLLVFGMARIAGVLKRAIDDGLSAEGADVALLVHEAEQTLLRKLLLLPEVVEKVVLELAPHHLTHYSQELASAFHTFYTQCRVIQADEPALTKARLRLLEATRVVLARTLALMGISAPDSM